MQIEVMSLRGSQWLQLFLEQAQIGQMVEHWCKEHLLPARPTTIGRKRCARNFWRGWRQSKGTPSCRRPSQFSSINRKAASDCCLPQAYRPQNSSPIGTLRAPTGQKTRTVVPRIAVGLCINRLQSGDNVQ